MTDLHKRNLKLTKKCEGLEEKNREFRTDYHIMKTIASKFISCAHPYTGKEQGKISRDKGYYPFIPNSLNHAMELLKSAKKISNKAQEHGAGWSPYFLDAGCGIGNIMCLASELGYITHGVERCRKNVNVAKQAVNARSVDPGPKFVMGSKVFCGDLFNFKHYHRYDVIYYYCPISDYKVEMKFEQLVEDKMKKGAVLVACNKQDHRIRKDKRFKQIDGEYTRVFLKMSK